MPNLKEQTTENQDFEIQHHDDDRICRILTFSSELAAGAAVSSVIYNGIGESISPTTSVCAYTALALHTCKNLYKKYYYY